MTSATEVRWTVGRLVFGPASYEARAAALVTAVAMAIRLVTELAHWRPAYGAAWVLVLDGAVNGLVVALAAGATMAALARLRLRWTRLGDARGWYLLGVASAAAVVALTYVVMTHSVLVEPGSPAIADERHLAVGLVAFAVALPMLLLTNGFEAEFKWILEQRERRMRGELDAMRGDRVVLLAAEERARQAIARTLHDDVQTELLRASMRLSSIPGLDETQAGMVADAVAEIDRAREEGVRLASRRLAPALAATGLVTALRQLGEGYDGLLDVRLHPSPAFRDRFVRADADDATAIAVYRVVEQALQNALKHGGAGAVDVALDLDGERVTIAVDTDGAAPPASWTPGVGAAVIDAWCDALGGRWSLGSGREGGARLRVVLGP